MKKKYLFLISLFMLLFNPTFVFGATDEYIFNSSSSVSSYGSFSNSSGTYEDGLMKILITNNDPVLLKVFSNGVINCDQYKFMKIKFRAMTSNNTSEIYFDTYENTGISEQKKIEFTFEPGKWIEKTINLSDSNQLWTGNLYRFRFDPIKTFSSNQLFYIEYIAFFKDEASANAYGGLTTEQKAINNKQIINDNVIIDFNIREIIDNIKFKSNVRLGYKDSSLRVTSFNTPAQFGFFTSSYKNFLLNKYPVIKIKYFSHSKEAPLYYYYDTLENPGLRDSNYTYNYISFNRTNDSWQEKIIDMSYNGKWNNTSNEFRFITAIKEIFSYDVLYIEYIGFFKNIASANAYGTLTSSQANATDSISLLFKTSSDEQMVSSVNSALASSIIEKTDSETTKPIVPNKTNTIIINQNANNPDVNSNLEEDDSGNNQNEEDLKEPDNDNSKNNDSGKENNIINANKITKEAIFYGFMYTLLVLIVIFFIILNKARRIKK